MMAANAGGNAVHSSTRMKTSHTWLASQTGVMDSSMSSRGAAPRSALPASRSQMPPPKSAPPNSAYAAMTTNKIAATAMASGEGLMARPARQRMPGARPAARGPAGDAPALAGEGPYGTCSASSSAGAPLPPPP